MLCYSSSHPKNAEDGLRNCSEGHGGQEEYADVQWSQRHSTGTRASQRQWDVFLVMQQQCVKQRNYGIKLAEIYIEVSLEAPLG